MRINLPRSRTIVLCASIALAGAPAHRAAADASAQANSNNWFFNKEFNGDIDITTYYSAANALASTYSVDAQAWNEGGTTGLLQSGSLNKFNNVGGAPAQKTWPDFEASVPAPGTTSAKAHMISGEGMPVPGTLWGTNYEASYIATATINLASIPAGGYGRGKVTVYDPWEMDLPPVTNSADTSNVHEFVQLDGSSMSYDPGGNAELDWHVSMDGASSSYQNYIFDYDATSTAGVFSSTLDAASGVLFYLNDDSGSLEFNPATAITASQLKTYLDGFATSNGWDLGSTSVLIGMDIPIDNSYTGVGDDPSTREFLLHDDATAVAEDDAPLPEPGVTGIIALAALSALRQRRRTSPSIPSGGHFMRTRWHQPSAVVLSISLSFVSLVLIGPARARADGTATADSRNWFFNKEFNSENDSTTYYSAANALTSTFNVDAQATNEGGTTGLLNSGVQNKFNNVGGAPAQKNWTVFEAIVPAPGTSKAVGGMLYGEGMPVAGTLWGTNYYAYYAAYAKVYSATIPAGGFGRGYGKVHDPWEMDLPPVSGPDDTSDVHEFLQLDGSSMSYDPGGSAELDWHVSMDGAGSSYQNYIFDYDATSTAGVFSSTLDAASGVLFYLNDNSGSLEFNPATAITASQLKTYLDGFATSNGWDLGSTSVLIGMDIPIDNSYAGVGDDPSTREFLLHDDATADATDAVAPEPASVAALGVAAGLTALGRRRR
jgi:hypothetical protein